MHQSECLVVRVQVKVRPCAVGLENSDADVSVVGCRHFARKLNEVAVVFKRIPRGQLDATALVTFLVADLNLQVAWKKKVGCGECSAGGE